MTTRITKHITKAPFGGVGAPFIGGVGAFLAILLFWGMVYPHHLHYQEQYQLFLFDSTYVWDVVRHPGGVADLLGRFCTQFFLYAWVGAFIIALLLTVVQLLTLRLVEWGRFYGLSFVPSFLLWLFMLDENALLGGVWAVLLTLLVLLGAKRLNDYTINRLTGTSSKRLYVYTFRGLLLLLVVTLLYWLVGCPLPTEEMWCGVHYHRYPTVFPWHLWVAVLSAVILAFAVRWLNRKLSDKGHWTVTLLIFALVATGMGTPVWKNANLKAEKVMQYDFMARHQQWNRILQTVDKEKPNNQIGVTVQNLALAMKGELLNSMMNYNQNGMLGLLPNVERDAVSSLSTAEAFYQLGMVYVAQRTVFEAQEAILDFQKSGRCYKRLAQTNLILGNYPVARKYLLALQKTLFYREWANETLPLLGNEKAIDNHPEYGHLRKCAFKEDFFFGDAVTPEMLQKLYLSNKDNHLAYEYMMAAFALTGDRNSFIKLKAP